MNFVVNLAAAVGIGFSIYEYSAGEQAGLAGVVALGLVVLVNETRAARRARPASTSTPAPAPAPAPAVDPMRDEINGLRRRVDELERAVLAISAR